MKQTFVNKTIIAFLPILFIAVTVLMLGTMLSDLADVFSSIGVLIFYLVAVTLSIIFCIKNGKKSIAKYKTYKKEYDAELEKLRTKNYNIQINGNTEEHKK